jgi:hypothetical protein
VMLGEQNRMVDVQKGMISKEDGAVQQLAVVEEESRLSVSNWAKELVTHPLDIMHGQWLYRNGGGRGGHFRRC